MKINQIVDVAEIVELMLDAVCVVDINGCFVYVSSAFEHIFGYTSAEVIGQSALNFAHPDDIEKTTYIVEHLLSGTSQPSFENRWVHKSGRIVHVLWSARWSEKHQMRVAVAHDITHRKQMEEQLQYLASHDPLTRLPNRGLLQDRLQTSIASAKRDGTMLCLMFLDINDFKKINDTHGHFVGDLSLKHIAKRLTPCVRHADTVGRLGGDEFLIVLNNISKQENAARLAKKISLKISQPLKVEHLTLHLTVSIGLALYPEHGQDETSLMQYADQAMYKVKREAKC